MKQETFYSVIFDDGRESTRRLFKNKENAIKKFEEQKKNFNLDQKKEKDYIKKQVASFEVACFVLPIVAVVVGDYRLHRSNSTFYHGIVGVDGRYVLHPYARL